MAPQNRIQRLQDLEKRIKVAERKITHLNPRQRNYEHTLHKLETNLITLEAQYNKLTREVEAVPA